MFFYVYRLTCLHPEAQHRYYYGVRTSKVSPENDTNYWSSSRYVREARARFGAQSFQKKIVSVYRTRQEALAKEIRLHAYFDVKTHPLFWNQANQTSVRFSGGPLTQEQRAKLSGALQGNQNSLGYHHKDAAKQKISQALQGNTHSLHRQVSALTKQKLSLARAGQKPFLGRKHSPETRAKIALTLSQRKQFSFIFSPLHLDT